MHPCPIGRGLSLLSNLFDLDCLYTSLITSEEELGTQSLLLLSPGRVHLEEVRDNRVRNREPTVGKGLPRCQEGHPPHPSSQGGVGGVLGDRGPSLASKEHHSPITGASDAVQRVLHSDSSLYA